MKKILIVGLGVITSGIINNILKKELFEIILLSKHCKSLPGVLVINDIKQLSPENKDIDVILTCFPTGEESILFYKSFSKFIKSNHETWLVEMTTSKPSLIIEAKNYCDKANKYFVECPITGSKTGSNEGTLSLFLHINEDIQVPWFLHDFFECISDKQYFFSQLTEPTQFKLLYNAWGAAILRTIKTYNPSRLNLCSTSLETANLIIKNDGWMKLVCESKLDQINEKNFSEISFELKYMLKDLKYARDEVLGTEDLNFNFLYEQLRYLDSENNNVDFSIIGR